MADGHSFNNISLGGRGGTNPGQLKVYSGGILWKKQGGGKAVEVDKSDILGLTWMKVPRTNQLAVRTKDGLKYKFTGFRDQIWTRFEPKEMLILINLGFNNRWCCIGATR
ncbi:hypothetical protein QVD17_20237 [Tagetes erecta]|uniref:FACT complex subunit SSRP1/POB3 N-terminal PH domain-containing protein n=1 Tax=Tagetes erecta TaxID=13708 RepID=A0AAD8KP94_TARER|nr:hypothetical protein QVD17_20237 [Tagetes erecta]